MRIIVPSSDSCKRFKEFLETYPLYRKLELPYSADLSKSIPQNISRECSICEKEQPFLDCGSIANAARTIVPIIEEVIRRNSQRAGFGREELETPYSPSGTYHFLYKCAACSASTLETWVYVGRLNKGYLVFKCGQLPEFDINVSREMTRALIPEDIELYKRARINLTHNFGIGACVYLRRLVEDHINPLLEAHLEKRTEEGAEEPEIETIRAIMKEKRMDAKIELVTTPHKPTGINPVGRMYEKLSVAIHSLSDNESTDVAQAALHIFEEVLIGLARRRNEEKLFKEKMKVLDNPRR